MPELPEVETVMRGLAGALAGRRLARVEQRRADLRFPLPERFAARLQGRRILGFERRAKYILAELDDGVTWLSHLGMSGRMMLGEGPAPVPERHDHVIVETDDGQHLIYRDARRFGFMDLIGAGGLADHPRLTGLGIEPLGPSLPAAGCAPCSPAGARRSRPRCSTSGASPGSAISMSARR